MREKEHSDMKDHKEHEKHEKMKHEDHHDHHAMISSLQQYRDGLTSRFHDSQDIMLYYFF
jgi:hypothetical protein